MAKLTPEEFTAKWAARTSGASEDYRRGVSRVQQAPGAAAAAQADLYIARVNEAKDKWRKKVAAVPLAEWQRLAAEKGAANLATGVQAATPKMAAAAGKLLSTTDTVGNRVRAMPKATLQQRMARAAAMMQGVHDAYR